MKTLALFIVLAGAAGFVTLGAQAPGKGAVLKLDPALDQFVSTNATVEVLVNDHFGLAEGPVWIQEGQNGYLLFTDVASNFIYKWAPDTKLSVFLDKAGWTGTNPGELTGYVGGGGRFMFANVGPNGVTVDPQGRIVWATHGDRNIVRLEKDGKRTVLADRFEGKRLNRPNDVVARSDGWVYFTDRRPPDNPTLELPYSGLYRVKESNNDLQLLDKEIVPNGLTFSPDEKILYVNGNVKEVGGIHRYDVQANGTLTNRRLFIDPRASGDKAPGGPDGMKVDRAGNLWTGGPGGIWIISTAGKHLGTILLDPVAMAGTARNMAFGDPDGKALYITTLRSLLKIRLNAPGITPGIRQPS